MHMFKNMPQRDNIEGRFCKTGIGNLSLENCQPQLVFGILSGIFG